MAKKANKVNTDILIYDIEVLSSMSADCGSICCMSYKYLGDKKIHTISIDQYPKTYNTNVFDDSKILPKIREVLDSAAVLVGHNAKVRGNKRWGGFDLKFINTRLILHGLPPITHKSQVDTYSDMARPKLLFRSDKLSELGKSLKAPKHLLEDKNDMQFPQDWNKVIIKVPGAMTKMKKRNKADVLLTEFVYNKLKPVYEAHPNVGLLQGVDKRLFPCPQCGSTAKVHNHKKEVYATTRSIVQRLVCRACNVYFKGPTISNKGKD